MRAESPRKRCMQRWAALQRERASWLDHWRELSTYIQPRRSRFLSSDVNKGGRRNDAIINSTATRAARTLAAGMMAGITSPARPWFRLTTPDPDMAESGAIRSWLHVVEERMRVVLARSNVYNALHDVYAHLGTFGTAACMLEEDEDVVRAYVLPVGQYALANSARLRVNTLYREFSMSTVQLVESFGLQACSTNVRNAYREGRLDEWNKVLHAIEPNRNLESGRMGPAGMAWRSAWYEVNAEGESAPALREGGFHAFPALCPRWDVTGEDVYGTSPGMGCLGDVRALQQIERRKGQLIAKLVTPPMKGPSNLLPGRVSLLPGETTYVDETAGGTQFAPAMVINPSALPAIEETGRQHEQRIQAEYYADLMMMLADSDRRQITATEVNERHEEKMLQLGPVMERLNDELLDPLVDRVFDIMDARGIIPPPPQELQGVDLRVEYISIMAAAQKLLGTAAVERLAHFVGSLAAVKPDILDKVDFDETVDEYASMLGTKPDLVVAQDKVDAIRAQRAQQQQQAANAQNSVAAAQGAKTLSETDMGGDSALTRLLGASGAGGNVAGLLPAGGGQ